MQDIKSQPFDCKKARDQQLPILTPHADQEEIVSRIISGKLYAFVGAGISVESGLPDWDKLLDRLLLELPPSLNNREEVKQEIKRFKDTDLVMAFELLKQVAGNETELARKIILQFTELKKRRNGFDGDPIPNDLHHLICRLPIRRVITTNYDRFLEQAAITSGRPRHARTRDDGVDLFDVIMNEEDCLIKIHGSTDKPRSIVAARSDYDRTYSGGFVNDWLEKCFIFNSFLFLGYSLRDIDIVSMIRHAKSSVEPKVRIGPHYGVFFDDHHGALLVRYLNSALELKIDRVRILEKAKQLAADHDSEMLKSPVSSEEKKNEEKNNSLHQSRIEAELAMLRFEATHDILVSLQGAIALRKSKQTTFGRDPADSFYSHVAKVARWAWNILGIDEIRVSLCEIPQRRSIQTIYRKRGSYESSDPLSVTNSTNEAYLLLREREYLYLSTERETSAAAFSNDASYKSGLVVSIAHGGAPIGLLEIYSIVNKAFSNDHLDALRVVSRLIAAAFSDNDLRMAHHQPHLDFEKVHELVELSPLYKQYSTRIKFITYDIDYTNGRLDCKFDAGDGFPGMKDKTKFNFQFGDKSLATHVFFSGNTVHGILRAVGSYSLAEYAILGEREGEGVSLSVAGMEFFDIKPGSWVYATTIRSKGQIAQILVAWSLPNAEQKPTGYRTVFERIKRIVRLIQNDDMRYKDEESRRALIHSSRPRSSLLQNRNDGRASKLITQLGRRLDQSSWKDPSLPRSTTKRSIRFFECELRKLLKISVADLLGLDKIRVWVFAKTISSMQYMNDSTNYVRLVASHVSERAIFKLPASRSNTPHNRDVEDGYVDTARRGTQSRFTRYTMSRFDRDPYARWQDRSMYGEEDDLNVILDKADGGFWVTAPLVWNGNEKGERILVGFISADCHIRSADGKPKDETRGHLMEFQRCALDLIAHVAVRCVVPRWHRELFESTIPPR